MCREKVFCLGVQTVYGVIAMHYPEVPKTSDLMMSWLVDVSVENVDIGYFSMSPSKLEH
jgi:hypothetical protein